MTAAIFGYGRFGRLLAHHLKGLCAVGVCDPAPSLRVERGIRRMTPAEAACADVVILAVPIRAMRGLLRSIAPLLRRGTVVLDVCSVKELPVRWMRDELPVHAQIIGTHPLFGPDSAARRLAGRAIVLTRVRAGARSSALVARLLRKLQLRIVRMTPAAHDRLMARSLFMTQFLGRALAPFELPEGAAVTENARHLSGIIASARRDSRALFEDMYQYNRFARAIPPRVLRLVRSTSRSLS